MPDRTLEEASRELHSAIVGLREFVEREFPKRVEVHRQFVKKEASRNRFIIVMIAVLLSAIFNLLASVTLVSTCFLTPEDGDHSPGICTWMPGYQNSAERNDKILDEFQRVKQTTVENQARIDELERQIP